MTTRLPRVRSLPGVVLLLCAVLGLTGCGTGGPSKKGDVSRGRDLFVNGANGKQSCASCHTLAAAGAAGTIGPNLDNAFASDRAQHFEQITIQQVVLDQIRDPACYDKSDPRRCMPSNLVSGSEAEDVAAYVASVAGTGAAPAPPPAAPPSPPPPPGPPPSGAAATGEMLYTSLGCKACHSLTGAKGIGPTFKGLAGSQVKLTGGQTVTASDAYLLESILDPDKQIVDGFVKGIMSATIKPGSVSKADADALVAFIKTLK